MRLDNSLALSFIFLSAIPFTFGCTKFGIDQDAKFRMLNSTRVFSNTDGGSAFGLDTNTELWAFQQYDGGSGDIIENYEDGASVIDENGRKEYDGGSGTFVNQPDGGGADGTTQQPDGNGNSGPNGVVIGIPPGGSIQPDGSVVLPNGDVVLPPAESTTDPEIRSMTGDEMIPVPGVALTRMCSDRRLDSNKKSPVDEKVPMALAKELRLVITNMKDEIICDNTDTAALMQNLTENGTLDLIKACGGSVVIPAKAYLLTEQNINLLDPDRGTRPAILDGKSALRGVEVLFADNPTRNDVQLNLSDETYELCDKLASPLFIDMRDVDYRDVGFQLTSQADGILFDILGENADPVAHTKKQISWFSNSAMAFIVMPDFNGNVMGINEMFGDNTKGPDGKFADNGFAALAKFDGLPLPDRINTDLSTTFAPFWYRIERVPDGVININDDVYHFLRLWSDHNKDGIATNDELISFAEAGIESIDLDYDPNFREVDEYGNQVKYKSAAETRRGGLRLVFDVWFKL